MKIERALFVPGETGFFFDDQRAIRCGLDHDGFCYCGKPVTAGFDAVRIPSKSLSVLLVLEDGQVALGDCCAVQYSGAGGRDLLFRAAKVAPQLSQELAPQLEEVDVGDFRSNAEYFDRLTLSGVPMHTAIRYGVTQALLDAAAKSGHITMTEIVAEDYDLQLVPQQVRVFSQSGDVREINVDKMIMKRADVMPHGLFNDIVKVGQEGEKLVAYVRWLRNRVLALRIDNTYQPEFHLNVYGTLGIVFEMDLSRIVEFLRRLESEAAPFQLRVEHPIDAGSQEAQLHAMRELMELIAERGLSVEIVADEWCNTLEDCERFASAHAAHMIQVKTPDLGGINNTIEAVLICKRHGVKAYLGGSCAETDVSARVSAHLALATQPHQMLAKPGMGVDEGLMIVRNEMNRTIALLNTSHSWRSISGSA